MLTSVRPALAQEITVGQVNGATAYPFSGGDVFPLRYQQAFASYVFKSAIFIDAIRFGDTFDPGAEITPGEYVVRFSTTSRPVEGLSTDFDSNLGADVQVFVAGLISGGLRI
jgi:hypothetical protein